MKKKSLLIYLFLVALFMPLVVDASLCSYAEQAALNAEVANLKVIYEEKTGILDPDLYDCSAANELEGNCEVEYNYFTISILNMSPNFNVSVKNNVNNKTKTYTYSDAVEGIVSFDLEDISEVTTFTFTASSSSKTNCSGEKYRVFYLTTPRYNDYSNYERCASNPDFYMCEKYVTFEDVDYYEFSDKLEAFEEKKVQDEIEKNKNFFEKTWDFIKENKVVFIVCGTALIVGCVAAVIIIRNKRKMSVL